MAKLTVKCHWCEKETENPSIAVLNGLQEWADVAYCDRCLKAQEECFTEMGLRELADLEDDEIGI